MRHLHGAAAGFDLFVPVADIANTFDRLVTQALSRKGGPAGWQALETVRIEAAIPRFRQDMDESNLAPETGIESRAISYSKGCYIGQEVIARIRTYGQVAKTLRGLKFDAEASNLPAHGDKLFLGDREVGYVTSTVISPALGVAIGLGYVRREHNEIGTELIAGNASRPIPARIVDLPFVANRAG
jgi:folate-binding protein YgfZ